MTNDTLVQVESHDLGTHKLFSLVETDMAQRLVEYAASQGWKAEILPFSGELDCPVANKEWIFTKYQNQKLHPEAENRLFDIGMQPWMRISQLIYADEIEQPNEIDWEKVRDKATSVLTTIRAGVGAIARFSSRALTELDPMLIAVCNDEKKTWVCICKWYSGKLEQ